MSFLNELPSWLPKAIEDIKRFGDDLGAIDTPTEKNALSRLLSNPELTENDIGDALKLSKTRNSNGEEMTQNTERAIEMPVQLAPDAPEELQNLYYKNVVYCDESGNFTPKTEIKDVNGNIIQTAINTQNEDGTITTDITEANMTARAHFNPETQTGYIESRIHTNDDGSVLYESHYDSDGSGYDKYVAGPNNEIGEVIYNPDGTVSLTVKDSNEVVINERQGTYTVDKFGNHAVTFETMNAASNE